MHIVNRQSNWLNRIIREKKCRLKGLTLIEMLFLIAVITVILALIVPVITRSRENARTRSCQMNLRQISQASISYTMAAGYLPSGYFWRVGAGANAGGLEISHGPLVSILPFMEEHKLYQAINFNLYIYSSANRTICGQSIKAFVCPSDQIIQTDNQIPDSRIGIADNETRSGFHEVSRASYAGVVGPWLVNTWKISGLSIGERASFGDAQQAQLGLFNACSQVRMDSVRDGASHTMAFGEHTLEQVPASLRPDSFWWFSGTHGDTLISTMFPINAIGQKLSHEEVATISASSSHPNKANFAFMDGSVRSIKDSISTFSSYPQKAPAGAQGQPHPQLWINSDTDTDDVGPDAYWDTIFRLRPGARFGLYQALSTRAGGERIPEDF